MEPEGVYRVKSPPLVHILYLYVSQIRELFHYLM
jgi:hypothetical protein